MRSANKQANHTRLPLELRADGYNEVSAVPTHRKSLRLDLNLEVSV